MGATEDSAINNVQKFNVEVSAHSHLVFSKLKQYNEVVFWERPEMPDLPSSDLDVIASLHVSGRIDNIASSIYGDSILWWALALANDIRLPPLQMNPGYLFRLIDGATIETAIRNRTV